MKIGILTYHFSDNYGALFQAYALRAWFAARGLDAEFINYHPSHVEEGGPFDRPWKPKLWRKNATIGYMKLSHAYRSIFGDKEQKARFSQFRRDVLGVAGARLKTAAQVGTVASDYDMLVCGSDQIWNPSIQRGFDPVYFLDIPGAGQSRKVAYAPSFGRSSLESHHLDELNRLVSGLDGISIRESTGLDVLKAANLSCEDAIIVPDPTILLGNFNTLLGDEASPNDNVFCYALRTDDIIREVAETVSAFESSPLIAPRSSRQRWRDIGKGIIPGPIEWLQTLASSKFVVSNSFHGIALSIVLNKPFIAVRLPGARAKMNARAENLLTIAGLTDRLIDTADPNHIKDLIDTPIDWSGPNAQLDTVRKKAESYLEAHVLAAKGIST